MVEIRTIPAKKDIAFVEFADEATATVAKDALHNFKIDGETKMKVSAGAFGLSGQTALMAGHVCAKVVCTVFAFSAPMHVCSTDGLLRGCSRTGSLVW